MNRAFLRLGFIPAILAFLGVVTPMGKAQTNAAPAPALVDAAIQADIATIKSHWLAYFLEPDYPDAEKTMKSQKPDGSWADVNYDDTKVAWSPSKHMIRLKQMAGAYAKPSSPFYHSPKMLAGVEKGLQFWYARKPKCVNWWENQIGQQLQLERILLLLEHDLPPDLMQTGLTYFVDLSPGSPELKATGENLVWYAGEYLEHGLLTANATEIHAALQIIQDTIVITDKEGIQADYSFHQHGPQLYNGGYGAGFLDDSVRYASYVAGTQFAFPPDKVDLLSHYLLDGSRWMMRGPMFDYGADGRGLVRMPGKPNNIPPGGYCDQLAKLDPPHAADYEALRATMLGTGPAWPLLGNKQFWRSDFMVEQTKDVYFSVKMNSSRTVGIELINGENLKGYWLPFGLTYIAPTGREYSDIFPVWDWAHLPGVTCPTAVYKLVNNFKQPDTFVGGVSDGTHGACAMKLDIESPGESLHAHKAWFFFGEEIVALGAGISSTLGDPVDTTLNQTLLKGPVVVDGKTVAEGEHDLKNVSWVLHNGIGYLFPDKSDVVVNNHAQTGSWQSISSFASPDLVSENVFSLWVNHGVKPTDGKYAYVVLGGADANHLADMAKSKPFAILSNTTDLQAVHLGDMVQAIFYSPGQLALDANMSLKVDQPCMLEVDLSADHAGTTIVLASPASGGTVNVTLNGKTIAFALPDGQMAGSSQTKTF